MSSCTFYSTSEVPVQVLRTSFCVYFSAPLATPLLPCILHPTLGIPTIAGTEPSLLSSYNIQRNGDYQVLLSRRFSLLKTFHSPSLAAVLFSVGVWRKVIVQVSTIVTSLYPMNVRSCILHRTSPGSIVDPDYFTCTTCRMHPIAALLIPFVVGSRKQVCIAYKCSGLLKCLRVAGTGGYVRGLVSVV